MSQRNHTENGSGDSNFEARDAHIRPLFLFLVGLAVLCVASFLIARSLQHRWNLEVDSRSAPHPMQEVRSTPTAPLLQPTTRVDLAEHRAKEDAILNGYGWIDAENDVVHIPVQRAMELLLERGLPARNEESGQ